MGALRSPGDALKITLGSRAFVDTLESVGLGGRALADAVGKPWGRLGKPWGRARRSSIVVRRSLSVVRRSSFAVCRSALVVVGGHLETSKP